MNVTGKYSPFYNWLLTHGKDKTSLMLTFNQLEGILGFTLPASAHEYSAWWLDRSENTTHTHAKSWLEAGWQVEEVDLTAQQVTFKRA